MKKIIHFVISLLISSVAISCPQPLSSVTAIQIKCTDRSIRGYFPSVSDADHYIVMWTDVPSLIYPLNNGTTYQSGDIVGNEHVFQYGTSTGFVLNNLQPNTLYYIWVMPVNDCAGSPVYANLSMNVLPVYTTNTNPYNYYFGNLHSHSTYSDGNKDSLTATPDNDFAYAKNSLCMDFLGISEHNHKGAGMHLNDWQPGLAQARAARTSNFLSLYGQEWGVISSGGHVITYGSDKLFGWESNNYDIYCPEGNYTGTAETTGSNGIFRHVNQSSPIAFATLAHPQDGDFDSLATTVYSPLADSVVVGCAVESGPAFSTNTAYTDPPSNMYYLDKFRSYLAAGYHVAPTIDHDNHYTTFGRTANSRLVVIAPSLDSSSFYEAMRNRHFYASQDCDTRVDFSINNETMGKTVEGSIQPNIIVLAADPTSPTSPITIKLMKGKPFTSILSKEVFRTIGPNGLLAYTDTALAINDTAYYYADILIAGKRTISAPIWYSRKSAILPLQLLNFTAKSKSNYTVQLNWQTTHEVNTKSFVIEHSANGVTFKAITTLPSQNQSAYNNYSFTDLTPLPSFNYYRLKQVDANGTFSYSNIKAVNFQSGTINSFVIQPNPVISDINLSVNSKEAQTSEIIISDITGRIIQSSTLHLLKGTQKIRLTNRIEKGMYFATILFKDEKVTMRFVKE